jgi:hypothetical protein
MLTFIGCFVAREFEEPFQEGMQMGTVPWMVYAPTRLKEHWKLPDGLSWKTVQLKVKRLQMRIAKAAKLKKYRLVQSLQWLLAHSFYGKLLSIKQVTSNKGKNTPGIDGVIWKTSLRILADSAPQYRSIRHPTVRQDDRLLKIAAGAG